MKNNIKSDLLVICKNKFFIWIFVGELILMTYNIFKIGSKMQVPVAGGYYNYIAMTLCFLIGIVLPIAVGAFGGGIEEKEKLLEYKLCIQSRNKWLVSKILTIILMSFFVIFILGAISFMTDLTCGTISSNIANTFLTILKQYIVVALIWIFWGIISFTIALLVESPAGGVILSLVVYFGEQYIGQYVDLPMGLMWNQKSIAHYFFNNESVPFGVVQSGYETLAKSSLYLAIVLFMAFIVSFIYLKIKYPNK